MRSEGNCLLCYYLALAADGVQQNVNKYLLKLNDRFRTVSVQRSVGV